MKLARLITGLAAIALLLGGFVASQLAALGGQAAEYAVKVDQAPIRMLALLILFGSIVLAFFPDRSSDSGEGRG